MGIEFRPSLRIHAGADRAEWLDLLEGQIGERRRLNLAGDNPALNYGTRKAFVNEVLNRYCEGLRQRG